MAWLQLTLESDPQHAEQMAELLEKFGAVSVSFSAVSNEPVFGQEETEPVLWQQTRVVATLYEETDLDVLLVCLRDRIGAEHILKHEITLLEDRDWISEYQQGHRPLTFGDRLCICPSWCRPPDSLTEPIILDPGLAFGTGSHATTSLCLEWLVANDVTGKTVIDYGCGSGILALAAARLGAGEVYAVDIDPQALQAARENIQRNHLDRHIVISHADEIDLPATDVLIANILMNPLLDLGPQFAVLVQVGGRLALSGLLATQAGECLAAYQGWFNMEHPVYRQEWALLQGTRA
ncbi:MAG: ribosomal protein L11 methyltransferase [Gammaproteobacteria bacterium RBG_16_51_14]|nr:MAG: ribosomal protein L11 methyltransferase [Gammaproteobacteria bacterium RBG_16_51_14]